MDTQKSGKNRQVGTGFRTNGLMPKTVASFVTVFFIFTGIPVPTSFAAAAPVATNETQQIVPVVSLEQANVKPPILSAPPVPSGSAIQHTDPLSSPAPVQVQATPPSVPAVPTGWTRAASNVNYAYSVGPLVLNGIHYYQALQVMDLRTAKIQVVTKTVTAQSRVLPESFVVDISPDGNHVVYQISGGSSDSKVAIVYNMWEKKYCENLTIGGATVNSIVFSGREVRISTTASALDKKPSGVYVVDVISGADRFVPDVPIGWTRTAGNEKFAFRTSSSSAAAQPGFILEVRDLLNGTVQAIDVASTGDSQISFCDVSRYGGVVIYSVSSSSSTRTIVQKLSDVSRFVTIPQGVSKIRCDIGNWVIILTLEDGSRLWIDGGALKVIPPPVSSGWTRAASNENYAFYTKSGPKSGSYTVQTLQVQDLRTGEIRDVVTTQPPVSKTFSRHDVSLDGNAVIYEMSGSMTVQKITDTSTKWSGVGIPQSILMEGDSVTFTYPDGMKARISTQTFQRIPLPIPAGWTRAASNANYAFTVWPNDMMELRVLSLLTGEQQVVRQIIKGDRYAFTGFVDVSPDGKAVVYEIKGTSLGQRMVEIYSMQRTFPVIVVNIGRAPLEKVEYAANQITVHVGEYRLDGLVSGEYRVELSTGKITFHPDVPAGWTRAASSPNYAFTTEARIGADRNNYQVLKVQNLITGTIKEVYSLQSPPFSYTTMDVSPSGEFVCYGARNNYLNPVTGWLTVQKVADPTRRMTVDGLPDSVVFLGNGDVQMTVLTSFENGTQLGTIYTVAHDTMTVSNRIKLVKQGSAVLKGGYLIIPERNTYSNTYTVTIFDAKALDNLRPLDLKISYHACQAAGGCSGSGSYQLIDVTTTPSGRKVLTVGIAAMGNSNASYSTTFLMDLATGTKSQLSGAATAVTYSGNRAIYTINGAPVIVDLTTFQVISNVPTGWTRAASNANYAYRIYDVPVPHAPSFTQALEVMNLSTGKTHQIATAFKNNAESLHDVDVISGPSSIAGGVVVIYKKTETSALFESINLYQLQTGQSFRQAYGYLNPIKGTLTSYTHESNTVVFKFSSGEAVAVDLKTMKVVPPTVPPIIRPAKGNAFNKTKIVPVKVNPFNKATGNPVKANPFNKAK